MCEFLAQLLTSVGHGNAMIFPLSSVLSWPLVGCSWKTENSLSSCLRHRKQRLYCICVCVCMRERNCLGCFRSHQVRPHLHHQFIRLLWCLWLRETLPTLFTKKKRTSTALYCMLDTESTKYYVQSENHSQQWQQCVSYSQEVFKL